MKRGRCRPSERGLRVVWPVDPPTRPPSAGENPVVVPYGRINGYAAVVLIWRCESAPAADAVYSPEIGVWVALRMA